jgi:hypothetical protein
VGTIGKEEHKGKREEETVYCVNIVRKKQDRVTKYADIIKWIVAQFLSKILFHERFLLLFL